MKRVSIIRHLTLFLWLIITTLAFIPSYEPLPEIMSLSDKLNHFVAFAVLLIFTHYSRIVGFKKLIGVLVGYALFIEVVQHFLPTRYFSLLDVVADGIGVVIGVVIVQGIKKYESSRCLKS
jgi:VanZ family protein